jgi:hypothetical protein
MSYGFASQFGVIERGTPVRDDREVCRSRTIVAQVTVADELLGYTCVRRVHLRPSIPDIFSLKLPRRRKRRFFCARAYACPRRSVHRLSTRCLPGATPPRAAPIRTTTAGIVRAARPGSLFAAMTVLTEWAL